MKLTLRLADAQRPVWQLSLCAFLSAAVYFCAFTLPYPLLQHYATPLLDLGKLAHYSQGGAALFVLSFALLFLLYATAWAIVRAAGTDPRIRRIVVVVPFVFAFILLWAFPIGAIDVYDHIFYSKMLAHYHANPLTHVPAEFSGDAWFKYVAWTHDRAPYGPLWAALNASVYALVGNNLLLNLLGFKLLTTGALLVNAALVYLIVHPAPHGEAVPTPLRGVAQGKGTRLREALWSFFFVAWNPLLLVEVAANAHNDALMLAFVLLALYCYQRRQSVLAVVSVTLAVLVKFPAVVLLPVFLIAALHQRTTWRARIGFLLGAGIASLATTALVYLPLLDGSAPFANVFMRQDLFTTSFAALELLWLQTAIGRPLALGFVRMQFLIIFAGALALLWLRLDGAFPRVARAAFAAMLLLLVIATFWFQAWYLAWVVVLAPFLSEHARRLIALFSWSATLNYLIYDFAWYWNPSFLNQSNGLFLNSSALLLIFGPPLAYAVHQSTRHWRLRGLGVLLPLSQARRAGRVSAED